MMIFRWQSLYGCRGQGVGGDMAQPAQLLAILARTVNTEDHYALRDVQITRASKIFSKLKPHPIQCVNHPQAC